MWRSLRTWMLDVMADVAAQRATNRMDERAIAIVVCPNLYDPPNAEQLTDPLAAMAFTQGMAKFVTELLLHYVSVRTRVRSASLVLAPEEPPAPPPLPIGAADEVEVSDIQPPAIGQESDTLPPNGPAFC